VNRSIFFKVFLVLVLIGAVVGLGAFAYNAGLNQGAAQAAQVAAGEVPAAVYPHYPMPYARPFFGFGFLWCLGPLFLLFLLFFALRGLFWHGPRGWGPGRHGPWGHYPMGGNGDWKEGVPPRVEEWHRRMHANPDAADTDQTSPEQV
jgi:hypothetical protein